MIPRIAIVLFVAGCAGKHQISGRIIDRNGEPLPRAVVSLSPGNVSLVTDSDGHFLIDYLRDESGKRTRLSKRIQYNLEVFKVGYHTYVDEVPYKRGPFEIAPVTMVEETIDVRDMPENLDPALYSRPTQSSGATYEGQ